MSILTINNLSCSYGSKIILDNLSLDIQPGHVVGLLGTNGCGKTTLLKCIGNIIPYNGNILFSSQANNIDIKSLSAKELAQKISYIPQTSGISIDLSCLDVVLMGLNPVLSILERPNNDMIIRAELLLKKLGLEEYIHTNYQQLSQGQKQLCLLARTLISNSPLLLLDEPESSLDFGNRYEFIKLIKKNIKKDRAALITLHDPQLALNYCDTIKIIHDKHCIASFVPSEVTEAEIEEIFSKIYGPVNITSFYNQNKMKHFNIMAVD